MSLRANLSSTLRRLAVNGVPTRSLSTSRLLTQQLSKSYRKVTLPQQLLRWNLEPSCYYGGVSIFQQPAASFHGSSVRNRSEMRIDETLNRLDTEIRRVGRIRRHEVDDILDDIKEMKKATSSQSLMIIRCCGELIPEEPPTSRTELVQQIWNTLESLKVPIDVSHYNALLRVYLENEHKFNPTEFLQDLTSKGVEPNRVTYQRLISRFCQDGDIDGASTILQYMKEKQMPINEYVFNALILGHGQANDMESAEGILAVMRQAGLEPNDDTYVTLMTCYAKQGDIQNIHRIVKECEEKEIFLLDRDFLNTISALAESNHDELIDEVLPYLKRHSGFNQEATNVIFRLTNMGHEESAFKMLKQMTPFSRQGVPAPSGNFFIKHLVHLSRPSEVIAKYCKILQAEGLHNYAFSRACEIALVDKKFDLAMDLFNALKEEGLPIRQHYFWPMLAAATTEKEVYSALNYMNEAGLTPNAETLRDYVVPKLMENKKKDESLEETLHRISSVAAVPIGGIASAAMLYLLAKGEMSRAVDFATGYKLPFGSVSMRRAIVDGYLKSKDASAFVKIIGSSSLDGDEQTREHVGMMLMELISAMRPSEKASCLHPVLKELLAHGLGLSNSGSEILQNSLGEGLTPEIANTIIQLTSSELTPKISLFPDGDRRTVASGMNEDKSTAELEQMLEDARKRNGPTKGIQKGLLYSYCRDRNVEKLTVLKDELIGDGFVFTAGMRAMMLDCYCQAGKVEEAKAEHNELQKNLDFVMDDLKILRYAHLLQTTGDSEGSLKFLKEITRDETRKPQGAGQQIAAWKLLNAVADGGNVSKVKEFFNLLNERNLLPISNTTLGPVIKAHLVNDDLEGAVEEFERCVSEHKVTPWRQELFCRLIKKEDADKLQKVLDLSTSVYGEVTSMYDLVFAFIDCGKVRQAKKILDTPGLRARNDKIEAYCQRYFQDGRVGELENLIQVTKDLMDVDRNSMYFYLLQTYCKLGEADKALSLWTNMQEENVQPSVELLIYLADFLRKNDRPIPFVVPDASEMISSSIPTSSDARESRAGVSRSVAEFRKCIDMNEVDKALQIKQRIESEGSSLTHSDVSSLIEGLARAERLNEATRLTEQMFESDHYPSIRVLRFLTNRLSVAGDINSIEQITSHLTPNLERSVMLNSRLCMAYVNAGRGEEFFRNKIAKTIESGIETSESSSDSSSDEEVGKPEEQEELGNVPVFACMKLLVKNEHLVPEFEKMAKQANALHKRALNNALWAFYMGKKDFSTAKNIWDTHLKSEERILFRNIIMDARANNDAELAMESVNQIMTGDKLPRTAKGVACGCAMDVLVNLGRLDEAMSLLESSLKTLRLEDYPAICLIKLKEYAESENKPFNYQIPARRPMPTNRRQYQGNNY